MKRSQLDYHPVRIVPNQEAPHQDWSSQVIKLLENNEYAQAESIENAEFETTKDIYAFRLMVSAAFKDERYYDCLKYIDHHPEILNQQSSAIRDLHRIALKAYLETRQLYKAEITLERCLLKNGDTSPLLLKKASILGAQAKYKEAAEILIQLNRKTPQNPAILKRAEIFEWWVVRSQSIHTDETDC